MDTHGEQNETEDKGTWSQKLDTHLRKMWKTRITGIVAPHIMPPFPNMTWQSVATKHRID